jgi:hypothetical protein
MAPLPLLIASPSLVVQRDWMVIFCVAEKAPT